MVDNRHITISLRLKLFQSMVSSAALFGLHVLPLSQKTLSRVNATEKRMLRSIVGWVRRPDDDYKALMSRMKQRVERALRTYPTKTWCQAVFRAQWSFAQHTQNSKCAWPRRALNWAPQGRRRVGRPRLRWEDHLRSIGGNNLTVENWIADVLR